MRVIIIAAGSSTRLGDLTKSVPKGLLDLNGKTVIARQLELYKKNKINDVVVIIGPHKEKFNFKDVKYVYDENHHKHDVFGSLMVAKNFMNTDLLISYSDIVFNESILKQMLSFKGDIGIGVDMNWLDAYTNRTMHPITDADNVLIQDQKIVHTKKNMSEQIGKSNLGEFIGLMRLSSKGAQIFVKTHEKYEDKHVGKFHESSSYEKAVPTDIFQELIDNDIEVKPIVISGRWCEIDTPEDFERAKRIFN